MNSKTYIRSISANGVPEKDIIAILDSKVLHKFILRKVATELSRLNEPCYYPRIADIYKELIHQTKADINQLKTYGRRKYAAKPNWRILNDPQTILAVLVAGEFAKNNDFSAGQAVIDLIALRFYTNRMNLHIKYCNPNYFRTALDNLSHNHLYNLKKTIGASVLHLSGAVFDKYKDDLKNDNSEQIAKMITELRNRVAQSVRSFANKYYDAVERGETTRLTPEDMPEKQNVDNKIRIVSNNISREITVYHKIDDDAIVDAQKLTSFNRTLAKKYANTLTNTKYSDELELIITLYLRELQSARSSKVEYIKTARQLMAVKRSNKSIFYKKSLSLVHDKVIADLGYTEKFNSLSIQSKGISRLYLSYYITLLVHGHFNN